METRIAILENRMDYLEARLVASSRRARLATVVALIAVVGAGTWTASPEARAQIGVTLASLNARLTAVEAKTAPITVVGTDFNITGMNVHIVDGTGRTQNFSGRGNLIVGYNERISGDVPGGSHNLVLGVDNNYASSGGLVAGIHNTISGPYASVSGGENNVASGYAASVSGGFGRTAWSVWNWVAGGLFEPL